MRLEKYEEYLTELLKELMQQIEREYRELYIEIGATFNENSSRRERAEHSVKLAQISGVSEDRIIRSIQDLDDLFG